jgi:Domain of unknown function (DUF1844)
MSDNSSGFTVTDRRKFTLEGELRDEGASTPASQSGSTETFTTNQSGVTQRAGAPPRSHNRDDSPVAKEVVDPELEPLPIEGEHGDAGEFEGEMPEVTAEESAEQHAAYRQSSQQLDDMVAKSNPGARRPAAAEMDFDKLVQSIYMTAALQLGAGTQPGEQPRVDILGARQSIDMLNVLVEKTKGNLTDKEQRLLQSALFELRMTFLEITNAIASSAHNPPPGTGPSRGGGLQ